MTVATQKEYPWSARAERTGDSQISWLLQYAIEIPGMLSLAAGLVDQTTLPEDLLREAIDKVFENPDSGRSALQYGGTAGLLELRQLMAKKLEKQGLRNVDPDCMVISNGGQQSLFTITECFVDPGDVVLVEDPTYFVYTDTLQAAGARVLGVTTDEEGIVPEALEERFEQLHKEGLRNRLKILYVMSYFSNPKGCNMSEERRRRVYDVYRREADRAGNFVLIEDASYRDLFLEGKDEPFIKSFDPDNEYVFTCGTFSKALAPGLRLGWSYMPKELQVALCRQKGNQDFGSTNMNQRILRALLESGSYEVAADRFRSRYRAKRDALLEAIEEFWPKETYVLKPMGGLYIWVKLPGINTDPGGQFFEEALREKVLYVPGAYCFCKETQEPKPHNAMRTCYGVIDIEPMREAVRRLGDVAKRVKDTT